MILWNKPDSVSCFYSSYKKGQNNLVPRLGDRYPKAKYICTFLCDLKMNENHSNGQITQKLKLLQPTEKSKTGRLAESQKLLKTTQLTKSRTMSLAEFSRTDTIDNFCHNSKLLLSKQPAPVAVSSQNMP